jgi:hypothetical protein
MPGNIFVLKPFLRFSIKNFNPSFQKRIEIYKFERIFNKGEKQ